MRTKQNLLASETTDAITLSPSEGTKLLVGLYNFGAFERTPFFAGPPGIGKTTFVKAAVEELRKTRPNFGYVELNPTMPADEVGGIPDLIRTPGKPTRTDYAMPSWFPTDPDWEGIICLDDMAQGDKLMQTTLANLIQARNLRMHPLPKGAMLVGTGNRAEDNAGSGRLLSHLSDRLTYYNIEAETTTWINDYAIPNNVDPRIVAYIHQYKDSLNKFDPKAKKCPTSRTWTALSTRMPYLDSLNVPGNEAFYIKIAQATITGELGMAEGTKFWAFCQLWGKVPNVDEILVDPTGASIDYPADIKYATAMAIAKQVTPDTFGNGLKYVERLGADMTAMVAKTAARNNAEIMGSQAFEDWCVSSQDMVHGFN